MNPLIKKQLEMCKVAPIPDVIDDSIEELCIEKVSDANSRSFKIHSCYLVELADYILNPSTEYTLADNWNKGIVPKDKYMKVEVEQLLGKMVKIIGSGFDPDTNTDKNTVWELWVPQKGIKILQNL